MTYLSAYLNYHPLIKQANVLGPALAGLGTVGVLGGGYSYYRNKRREARRKERDMLWREKTKQLVNEGFNGTTTSY